MGSVTRCRCRHLPFLHLCSPTVVPETPRYRRKVLQYLSNSTGTAPPPHERAIKPKNILRQLSIRKEDCLSGEGGGCGLSNLPTVCRFLVASVVKARHPALLLPHSKSRDRERSAKRLVYYGRGFAVVYASSLVDNYKDRSIERENHTCLGIDRNGSLNIFNLVCTS